MTTKAFFITLGILATVLGYFGQMQFTKLAEIEKSLVEVKLEMVRIQATMMDRETVIAIVREEIKHNGK